MQSEASHLVENPAVYILSLILVVRTNTQVYDQLAWDLKMLMCHIVTLSCKLSDVHQRSQTNEAKGQRSSEHSGNSSWTNCTVSKPQLCLDENHTAAARPSDSDAHIHCAWLNDKKGNTSPRCVVTQWATTRTLAPDAAKAHPTGYWKEHRLCPNQKTQGPKTSSDHFIICLGQTSS